MESEPDGQAAVRILASGKSQTVTSNQLSINGKMRRTTNHEDVAELVGLNTCAFSLSTFEL